MPRITVEQIEDDGDDFQHDEDGQLFTARVQLKQVPQCLGAAQQHGSDDEERAPLVLLQFELETMKQFIKLARKEAPVRGVEQGCLVLASDA